MCEPCSKNCKECIQKPDQCLQCNSSLFFWENKCFNQCPNITIAINTTQIKECQTCKMPCLTCTGNKDNCTSCSLSPVLHYYYQGTCRTTCPKKFLPNNQNICTQQDEPTYPFLSLILTGLTIILVISSNLIYPNTRMLSAYLALQSLMMIPIWLYLLIFLAKDSHTSSLGLSAIGLICNSLLNCFWHSYYKKKIVAQDFGYQRYMQEYPKTQKLIVLMSYVFTFQFFRIQYSRLFNSQTLSCTLQMKDKFYKKLNRYSLLQLTLVYLPILSANIYNLQWTWYGRQVFWIDIECIITTTLLLIVHVLVITRTEQLFVQDKYEDSSRGDSRVDCTQVVPQQDTTSITQIREHQGKMTKDMMEQSQSIEGLEEEFEDIMRMAGADKKNHRTINEKQYVTLGEMQGGKIGNQSDKYDSKIKKHLYDRLQQDSSRTMGEINGPGFENDHGILNDLEYTSAPIGVEKVLQENSPARRKLSKFQEELEDIKITRGRKKKGSPNKRSSKDKSASPGKNKKKKKKQQSRSPPKNKKSLSTEKTNTAKVPAGIVKELHLTSVGSPPKKGFKSIKTEQTKGTNAQMVDPNIVLGGDPIKVEIPVTSDEEPKQNGVQQIVQEYASMILKNNASIQNNEIVDIEQQMQKEPLPRKSIGYVDKDQVELIIQEILQISQQSDQDIQILNSIQQENNLLLAQIQEESIKKEELQIVVEDLNQHIATLLQAFNQAVHVREDEFAIIDNGNFTSDEDDMGISPSAYNKINAQQKGASQLLAHNNQEQLTPRANTDGGQNKKRKRSKGKKKSRSKSKSPKKKEEKREEKNGDREVGNKNRAQVINFNQETFPSLIRSNKNSLDDAIYILNQAPSNKNDQELIYESTSKDKKEHRAQSTGVAVRDNSKVLIEDSKIRDKSQTRQGGVRRNPLKQSLAQQAPTKTSTSLPPTNRRRLPAKQVVETKPVEPERSRSKSKVSKRSKKSNNNEQPEEDPPFEAKKPRKRFAWKKKKKAPEDEPSSKKHLKKKRRRRFLKKKKRKSKKGKRKSKKKGKRSRKGKKKGAKKSNKVKQVAPEKVVPYEENKIVEVLEDSAVVPFDLNDMDEYQDVDQLSASMTHSEFVRILEEDNGAYILEDITDQLKEQYQEELEQTGALQQKNFNKIAKKRLKMLASENKSRERKKLRAFINDLNLLGKQHIQEWYNSIQDSQVIDEELKLNMNQEEIPDTQHIISDEDQGSFDQVMELDDTISNLGPDFQNGLPTADGLLPKTKLVKKKKTKQQQDQISSKSYDAYFKYLPFEKTVIESKGKAPYSNYDVDQMSQKIVLLNKNNNMNQDLKK